MISVAVEFDDLIRAFQGEYPEYSRGCYRKVTELQTYTKLDNKHRNFVFLESSIRLFALRKNNTPYSHYVIGRNA